MKITQLFIYPIKGLAGISVKSALVMEEGFEHDRRWMLVDKENNFVSQRTDSRLALFRTRIDDDLLTVCYKEGKISYSLNANEKLSFQARVWDDVVEVSEVSFDVSRWFSEHLDQEVKLVRKNDQATRYKKLIKGAEKTKVSFADGYPYLIIGTESIAHLNNKLSQQIDLDRFRGNIIVDTTEAHIEDTWDKMSNGNAILEIIKPCARCQVINIDQTSAEKSKEPLKTLSTYRSREKKIYFGANAIALETGILSVGDEISF